LRKRYLVLLWAATITSAAWCDTPPASFDKIDPTQVARGKTVRITGTHLPDTGVDVLVKRFVPDSNQQVANSNSTPTPPTTVNQGNCPDDKSQADDKLKYLMHAVATPSTDATKGVTELTFLVPESAPLGEYEVCIYPQSGKKEIPILGDSGHLVVTNDSSTHVQVSGTTKPASYPDSKYQNTKPYAITILGDGFSSFGPDNQILLNGKALKVCWKTPRADRVQNNCPTDCPDAAATEPSAVGNLATSQELGLECVRGVPEGISKLQVRLGSGKENISDPPIPVTLSPVSENTPKWVAGGVLVGVIILILLLGSNRSHHQIGDQRVSLLSALLLDASTDTYSLSKAQFYAWTAAVVFGYSYLTLALSWIQGRFEFASIPDKLPGILLVSATTATVSLGMNPNKPKGAGTVQPGLQDFITTGGVVAAERVQFLVWTILGILTFMFLIISSDPATITTLPAIPSDFLTLMGVSSAGYLGGRLARKAGPIIDDIMATVSSLTLEIHGRNLSQDASFQIDGADVTLDMIAAGASSDHRPKIVAKDDTQDAGFAKILSLTLDSPKTAWLTRKSDPSENLRTHTLSIINPDGQCADWTYSIAGPTAIISSGGKPVADGSSLPSQKTDTPVSLDASASTPGDDKIAAYEWRRVDTQEILGATSTLSKTFPAGTFAVKLTVTDSQNQSSSATVNIVVTA
jgi:hypothetical protein